MGCRPNRLPPVVCYMVAVVAICSVPFLFDERSGEAATLVVTSADDPGPGSLREAIQAAAPGDTITFAPALAGGTITLNNGLVFNKDLTIDGPPERVTIFDTSGEIVLMRVQAEVHLQLLDVNLRHNTGTGIKAMEDSEVIATRLDIRGGDAPMGGAVEALAGAHIVLAHSVLAENTAGLGSAILGWPADSEDGAPSHIENRDSVIERNTEGNQGTIVILSSLDASIEGALLDISRSTIRDNIGAPAIYVGSTFPGAGSMGNVSIVDSTISGNVSIELASAISNDSGVITMTNSTISDNINGGSSLFQGTIFNGSLLFMHHVTVAFNQNPTVGAALQNWGTFHVENSIIASQSAGADCRVGIPTLFSDGYNLGSDGTCLFYQPTDNPSGNANLAPLQVNPPG